MSAPECTKDLASMARAEAAVSRASGHITEIRYRNRLAGIAAAEAYEKLPVDQRPSRQQFFDSVKDRLLAETEATYGQAHD